MSQRPSFTDLLGIHGWGVETVRQEGDDVVVAVRRRAGIGFPVWPLRRGTAVRLWQSWNSPDSRLSDPGPTVLPGGRVDAGRQPAVWRGGRGTGMG